MNYDYILFVISFIVFGIHNSISSRIKDGEILVTKNMLPFLLFRSAPFVGYIVLGINLFYKFYWMYSVILFLAGLLIVPSVFIKFSSFIVPRSILKYIINPYLKTILVYITLSILMIVLLTINLF